MDEAVEYGVGEGGFIQLPMLVGHRQLAREDRRASTKAVVADHEQVAGAASTGARPRPSSFVELNIT